MATAIVAAEANRPVYLLPSGDLVFPGTSEHEILEAMQGMTESEQRKVLQLAQLVTSGEFDVLTTVAWTDQQRRDFMNNLTECNL